MCPQNTNSLPGSSDLASCTCNAGYKCQVTKVVHAEVTLPITIQDFDSLRQKYIAAVAAAAGVDPSQVVIVSVTNAPAGGARRRLLDATHTYIEIHTSIYNSQHTNRPHMALTSLQTELARQGLPPHKDVKLTLHREVQRAVKM